MNKNIADKYEFQLHTHIYRAANDRQSCTITEEAPTRAFSWLRH